MYSGYSSTSGSPEIREYRGIFNASIEDPAAFWAHAAGAVSWIREPRRVLDDSNPPHYRRFPDGELNTRANALDRHVADGRAKQAALIHDSPVTGSQRTNTYGELLESRGAARSRSTQRDRCRRVLQIGRCRCRAAEDAFGKDLAKDDARHRTRQGPTLAVDHRGPILAPRPASDSSAVSFR
jgi:hypothetical protein